jgi:hypothetical protein
MKTIAALQDPDVLLVSSLETHRRGPEKLRPDLQIHVWCPHCRHHHHFPWPESFRLEAALGPVEMPCRCRPFDGKAVYLGLDPDQRGAQRWLAESFRATLRRFEIQRRLERQFAETRAADRSYLRDFPEAIHSSPPVDYLGAGRPPMTATFNQPRQPM